MYVTNVRFKVGIRSIIRSEQFITAVENEIDILLAVDAVLAFPAYTQVIQGKTQVCTSTECICSYLNFLDFLSKAFYSCTIPMSSFKALCKYKTEFTDTTTNVYFLPLSLQQQSY